MVVLFFCSLKEREECDTMVTKIFIRSLWPISFQFDKYYVGTDVDRCTIVTNLAMCIDYILYDPSWEVPRESVYIVLGSPCNSLLTWTSIYPRRPCSPFSTSSWSLPVGHLGPTDDHEPRLYDIHMPDVWDLEREELRTWFEAIVVCERHYCFS